VPYAASLSIHPDPAIAAGEIVGELLDALGGEQRAVTPQLATVFVTGPHVERLDDIVGVVRSMLRPAVTIGATAVSVLGGSREVETAPGISVWVGAWEGPAPVPVRLTVERVMSGAEHALAVEGLDPLEAAAASTLLLLPDPFTFPVDAFVDQLARDHPHLAVIGGLASAAGRPGGNRLAIDGTTVAFGAVGVLLDRDVSPSAVVSQGCRPIGEPYTVTAADGQMLLSLGGRPALERLMEIVAALDAEDRQLAARGLHCGIVANETKLDFERGDFLIRGVMGIDRERAGVAIGDVVPVGATVQFQVRDAASADEDLRELMADRASSSANAAGALVFTCNGRGTHLFGMPHHDAEVISDLLDTTAVAGMFCAGELGPIGGRNALHGFTASVAVFTDPPNSPSTPAS
jgi:small ligand-binding sensory domain FIST